MENVTLQYEKALGQLIKAVAQPRDEFVRDSIIQRFEFTFELAWKTSKKVLGTQSVGPRVIIREMAQQGFINDVSLWFKLLEARNLSVHAYNEELADRVSKTACDAVSEFEQLLVQLKKVA